MRDLKKHTPKSKRPLSEKQEKRVAERLNGERQPGSGSGPTRKGDVDCRAFLIESKSTVYKSIRVKLGWLDRITRQAFAVRKAPGLSITFKDVPPGVDPDWVMIPLKTFKELTGEGVK